MEEKMNCMVCGEGIEGEYHVGKIGDLDAVFCDTHKDFCETCDYMYTCNEDGVCRVQEMN